MIRTFLVLLVIGWLPGAVLFRLPILDRERRAALDAEERLFWAIVLSLTISLSIVLLLASIGQYSFGRLLVADVGVAVAAALGARFRLRLSGRRPTPSAVLAVALVVLGLTRFFPPAEYIIGGRDPGTYVNEGIQIAQRGALVLRDPTVAAVPPFARNLFFPSHERTEYHAIRFMGFFIQDPDQGTVVGQFPHLFPASIAIGYGVDGLTGARRVPGVWAILGVLAVYFAGARLIGRLPAGAAAALLALNVIQVWFARYPNAEVVMQALLFAAILANARAHVDGDRFFAPIAGVLLGLLLFLRIDMLLAVAGVALGLALAAFKGGRPRLTFVAPLGILAILAAVYLLGPMRAYSHLPIVFLSNFPWWQYALIAAGSLSLLVAIFVAARNPRVSERVVTYAPLVLSAVVIVLGVYALWLREPGGRLAARDAYALRTFASFYVTVPAVVAALIGYYLTARRAFWRDPVLITVVTLFALFFFYKIRIYTDHFWMARRFLPVILPGTLLFASAAALGVRTGAPRLRILRTAIGLVFVALLASQYARASRPLLDHVEYAGIIPKLEQLASTIGDEDLLIVEAANASDTHVLGLPLAYVYARNVLVLANQVPHKPTFAAFLDWARTRYRRVLFMGGGGTDLLSRSWSVDAVATERFQVPEYDAPVDAYPRFAERKEFDYSVYALTPPRPVDPEMWFDLDLGVRDDLHVLRFHAKETTEGRTFRWSRDRSYVSVTTVRPSSREVRLWMSNGGRPAAAPPAVVTITLADTPLGTIRVVDGFHEYALPIPAALATRVAAAGEPVRLTLTSSVWKPRAVLGTPDDRDLGVMVDRVAVK